MPKTDSTSQRAPGGTSEADCSVRLRIGSETSVCVRRLKAAPDKPIWGFRRYSKMYWCGDRTTLRRSRREAYMDAGALPNK